MRKLAVGIAMMLFAVCVIPASAELAPSSAKEIPPLPVPKPKNIHDRIQRAKTQLCDKSTDPESCRIEFDHIDSCFMFAEMLFAMAAIAHPGPEQEFLKQRAELHATYAGNLLILAILAYPDSKTLAEMNQLPL